MSGIDWDVVTEQCQAKAAKFAKDHPNQTTEAAYYAGYMENAGERESLRAIAKRLEKYDPNPPLKILTRKESRDIGLNAATVVPSPVTPSMDDLI